MRNRSRDTTLPVILAELSTIADFLDYLRKKEALYDEGKYVRSFSELDLLGYFLWNNRAFPEVGNGPYATDRDLWARVEADKGFLRGREENMVSAFWDGLIEYLTDLYMKEELEHGNDYEVIRSFGLSVVSLRIKAHRLLLARARPLS